MDILLSTVTNTEGMWKKTTNENHCSLHGINHCQMKYSQQIRNNRGILIDDDLDDDYENDNGKKKLTKYQRRLLQKQAYDIGHSSLLGIRQTFMFCNNDNDDDSNGILRLEGTLEKPSRNLIHQSGCIHRSLESGRPRAIWSPMGPK